MERLLPILVAWPLACGFLVVALAQVRGLHRLTGLISGLGLAGGLGMAVELCRRVYELHAAGGQASFSFGLWSPAQAQLYADGLSSLLLLIINFVGLAILIYSVAYMRRYTSTWLFQSLFLVMVAAMNGLVLAGDLFTLYIFIETAALASYALVAFGCEAEELEASFRYLVMGVIASTFILVGVAQMYSLTGQLNMIQIATVLARGKLASSPALLLAAGCLLAGLAIKAAMVPFHAWLSDAHPSAPAPISAMMSGVLIKTGGVYAIARIVFSVLGANASYAQVLMAMGGVSMVVGALLSLGQWDIKRMLAYSSISQMGYVMLALGAGAYALSSGAGRDIALLCLVGAFFHLFNHAGFKSLLFLASGSIEYATGTRRLDQLGGLAQRMPVTGFCCRIGALSIAGIPPFNGFFSKLVIVIALVLAGLPALAVLAVAVAVLTLLIAVKLQRYALDGQSSLQAQQARESPWPMGLSMVVLALVCIGGGLAFFPLRQYLFDPAGQALLQAPLSQAAGALP